MAICEMCGKEGSLVTAQVEGTELRICQDCSKFGQVHKQKKPVSHGGYNRSSYPKRSRPEFEVMADYSKKLQQARNQRNMTQEEFAKMLNEKMSVVQKWESGILKPRIDVAKRLERQLNFQLLKQIVTDNDNSDESSEDNLGISKKKNSGEPTLGDFIKVRKRKK
jgi:putative transcription factor